MRSYQQAFGAGESKDFIIDAKFFFLFEALNAVTVQFWKNSAPSDDLALDVLAGFKCRPVNGFDRITITSSAAQTIKFFIAKGEGDYERLLGSVQLIGDVALNAASLAAMKNMGLQYVASHRSITLLAANTPETIITPGANVNGVIIHSAQFVSDCATCGNGVFLAKTSAPATAIDGEPILGGDNLGIASAGHYVVSGSLKNPVRIAAGKGLYFISTLVEIAANRSVLYTLL